VLRATRAIFWGPPAELPYPDVRDAQGCEWVAPILLVACILLFGLAPDLLLQYIDPMTLEFLGPLGDRIADSTAGVTP